MNCPQEPELILLSEEEEEEVYGWCGTWDAIQQKKLLLKLEIEFRICYLKQLQYFLFSLLKESQAETHVIFLAQIKAKNIFC